MDTEQNNSSGFSIGVNIGVTSAIFNKYFCFTYYTYYKRKTKLKLHHLETLEEQWCKYWTLIAGISVNWKTTISMIVEFQFLFIIFLHINKAIDGKQKLCSLYGSFLYSFTLYFNI